MLRCFACKGSRNRAKNKTNGLFFFNRGEWDTALLMAPALAKGRLPLGRLSLRKGLAADENGQLANGKWSHRQWIMGSIRCVAADTQQWISCHTTVEQPSHNNGTTVTDVDTILLRAFKYVKRGIANFYQFCRVNDVQEGEKAIGLQLRSTNWCQFPISASIL